MCADETVDDTCAMLGAVFDPGLTDDDGAHVLPADAQLVPGLADEGGVDSVVHLLHHQLVVHHQHRVGQEAGRPGEGRGVCVSS